MTDCIAQAIWWKCKPKGGFLDQLTAQQRHAWDEALRAELAKVEPAGLRAHAADMIREWRDSALNRRDAGLAHRVAELEARIAKLEARP